MQVKDDPESTNSPLSRLRPPELVAAGLRRLGGDAPAVARLLRCDLSMIEDYLQRFPEVAQAQAEGQSRPPDIPPDSIKGW